MFGIPSRSPIIRKIINYSLVAPFPLIILMLKPRYQDGEQKAYVATYD